MGDTEEKCSNVEVARNIRRWKCDFKETECWLSKAILSVKGWGKSMTAVVYKETWEQRESNLKQESEYRSWLIQSRKVKWKYSNAKGFCNLDLEAKNRINNRKSFKKIFWILILCYIFITLGFWNLKYMILTDSIGTDSS